MNRSEFDNKLEALLEKAESVIPDRLLPDLPYLAQTPNTPGWYPFELELWNIGEQIRLLVAESNKAFHPNQLDRIMNICLDKNAKRGRQSFVMLLGRKKYSSLANTVASLLNDTDVNGHIIDTLYKMGAGQYSELIRPYLSHEKTWIRNGAKRYLQKYE